MKYQQYKSDDLQKAISLVHKGWSLRKASSETRVPISTIKDHARGKYVGIETKPGGVFALTLTEENALVNYIQFMGQRGFPLTRKIIKKITCDILKASNRKSRIKLETGPTNKWVRQFLKRHKDLSLRKPHPLEKDRSNITNDQITHYFNLLGDTLDKLGIKNDPTRIFNFDETGISGKERGREKIVLKKGTKHPYQPIISVSGHVTLQLAISGAGKAISPLVIFSKSLPRGEYDAGIPEEWTFATSESGYINNEIFLTWFRDSFAKQCGRTRPVLVVMDNHATHLGKDVIDVARQEQIELLCLPSHSTHLLQPLDVGFYHLLKSNMASLSVSLGYTGLKTLPREKFTKLLHLAINRIRGSDVSSAFSCVGICPFDPKKVRVFENSETTAVQSASTPENIAENTQNTSSTVCDKCGKGKTENELVRLGFIPECLQEILTVPSKTKPKSGGKRKRLDSARVITTGEPKNDDVVVGKKVKKSLKCKDGKKGGRNKGTGKKTTRNKNVSQNDDTAEVPEDTVLCEICMTNCENFTWIGCDTCERWQHYECLPYEQRTLIDLSLVTMTPWLCNRCIQEE